MLKKLALLFGILFLVVGVLGFVPAAIKDGLLLGLFHGSLLHNLVRIAIGLFGVYVGLCHCTEGCAKWCSPVFFFRAVGVFYAIIVLLGFVHVDEPALGYIAGTHADTILRSVVAVVSLYLGFVHKE